MRFATLAAIGLVAVEAKTKVDPKENILWYVDGVKGYHEGYEKAFYKSSRREQNSKCLNDETINNMVTFGAMAADPIHMFKNIANVQTDFTLFSDAAQIIENVATCRFEGPAFDILHTCSSDKTACAPTKFVENLTKNMFVLVGKMTSMAETLKGFPQKNREDFKEQMMEVGDDFGTFARITFNYHSE